MIVYSSQFCSYIALGITLLLNNVLKGSGHTDHNKRYQFKLSSVVVVLISLRPETRSNALDRTARCGLWVTGIRYGYFGRTWIGLWGHIFKFVSFIGEKSLKTIWFGHGFCRFINFSVRQHVAKEARFAVSTAPDHIFCVTKHVDLLDKGDVRWSHVRIGK